MLYGVWDNCFCLSALDGPLREKIPGGNQADVDKNGALESLFTHGNMSAGL
jgi:hypothetical protein